MPGDTDDFEVLGSFYGAPAKMVKCETIDVVVPANADLVLECELMASEGLTFDEGPYGEYTGMYGGGLKHNYRIKVKALTYRKGGIYQHGTIGGLHPWFTDNMLQLPAIEADLFGSLKRAGIDVSEVRAPAGGLSNIAYAKIKPLGAGDAKQALGIMLTCSKQGLPKVAMVFDDDVDIWDDQAVLAAMAFRFMPDRDTVMIKDCNTMTVDPKCVTPGVASKIGMDCTIPLGPSWNPEEFVQERRGRPRRASGRRQGDGRGGDDERHARADHRGAAVLARDPGALPRAALPGDLPGLRQSSAQARTLRRRAVVPLHGVRRPVRLRGEAAAAVQLRPAPRRRAASMTRCEPTGPTSRSAAWSSASRGPPASSTAFACWRP